MSNFYDYDFLNLIGSSNKPGTVHAANTALGMRFRRYLFQKTISVFDWTLPENWSKDYFLYVLYAAGFVCIADYDGFGVIPQYCSLIERNVFYEPKKTLTVNPAFNGRQFQKTIGRDCEILKLTPDYLGITDIVGQYADAMALCWETTAVNLVNSKLAYVFAAKDKAQAQSFKAMVDEINEGQPAVFIDKKLFDEDGKPTWMPFDQNVGANFIVPEILEALSHIEARFDQEIGLPNNMNIQKERVTNDAVHQADAATYSKAELWLTSLQEGIEKAVAMFPELDGQLSVEWRKTKGGASDAVTDIDLRTILSESGSME